MTDHTTHPRLERLRTQMQSGELDTLIVAFTDMQGRLMGKRVNGAAFLDGVIDHGAHVCTYLLGTDMEMSTPDGFALMNWQTGYGDYTIDPVWDTLRVLPWQDRTALVLGDVLDDDHAEVPVSPRTILKGQVAAAAEMGMAIKAGSEFEYFLLTDTYEGAVKKGFMNLETFGHYNEDYHLLQGTKAEPVHGALRRLMHQAEIPIEFSKGEAGPGQHELNIRYDHVMESADRSVIFKHGAKEIAWGLGYGLTFMAKPDHTWTGSSGHLHMSAWGLDDDRSLMFEQGAEPYGMSPTMRWFMGGMMKLARELSIFYAPNINSYKRFAVASWAPVNVVWGRDNRTTGFRVVGNGPALHIECRFPGGDMNAYLTYAAFIGAGLWGIRNQMEPPAELRGNGYVATGCDRMPRALYEAIRAMEASEAAREILGDVVVDHYLTAARLEQEAYDAVVHPWERQRYLERG